MEDSSYKNHTPQYHVRYNTNVSIEIYCKLFRIQMPHYWFKNRRYLKYSIWGCLFWLQQFPVSLRFHGIGYTQHRNYYIGDDNDNEDWVRFHCITCIKNESGTDVIYNKRYQGLLLPLIIKKSHSCTLDKTHMIACGTQHSKKTLFRFLLKRFSMRQEWMIQRPVQHFLLEFGA